MCVPIPVFLCLCLFSLDILRLFFCGIFCVRPFCLETGTWFVCFFQLEIPHFWWLAGLVCRCLGVEVCFLV